MSVLYFKIINLVLALCVLSGVIWYARRIYIQQGIAMKGWKIVVVMLISLFQFKFDFNNNDNISIPIAPLGVWILYFILRQEPGRWERYRKFAWLSFLSLYAYLLANLIAIPLNQVVYPEDRLTTYYANVNHAELVKIHQSAPDASLNIEALKQQLNTPVQSPNNVIGWYNEHQVEGEPVQEKFPYLLVGEQPKWGSGILHVASYVEHNGRGILLSYNNQQYYYQFDQSIIKVVTE